MSKQNHSFSEFYSLLDAACEDRLTAEQSRRLEKLLRSDESARREYEEYLHLNLELHFASRAHRAKHAAKGVRPQGSEVRSVKPASARSFLGFANQRQVVTCAAAAAVFLVLLTAAGVIPWGASSNPTTAMPIETVGKLTNAVAVKWRDTQGAPSLGEDLAAGQRLVIDHGVAEITFRDGAKISVAGPASLQLSDAMAMRLFSGRLTATVPSSAVGFRVDLPNARLIDKGTAFGVNVVANGDDEIHVFEGQVDAFIRAGSSQGYDKQVQLRAGQAAQFNEKWSAVRLSESEKSPLSPSLALYLENQGKDIVAPTRQYILSQSYLVGPAPGTFAIEDGEINLRAGLDNTVCVMVDESHLSLPSSGYLEVVVPPLKHPYDGVFLMCSSVPRQPGGTNNFGLRLRRDVRGIWVMPIKDPEYRSVLETEFGREGMNMLPDPGGALRFSIERVTRSRFRCYYQPIGSDSDPVFVDEIVVPQLESYDELCVGVQAYCFDEVRNYRFTELDVIPVASQ